MKLDIILTSIFIGSCVGLLWMLNKEHKERYKEKLTYCHIDSVSIMTNNNKCWTDCGQPFFTKKGYRKGDSIQIKTIIIEN